MVILALLSFTGYGLIRGPLQDSNRLTAVFGGVAFALVLFLTLTNGLGQFLTVREAAWAALVVQLLLGLAGWLGWPRPAFQPVGVSRWGLVWLITLGFFAFAFLNLNQNLTPDDDYWVHTPLQSLMALGNLPPSHPFFPDIVMNGHYGRDLLISSLSILTGFKIFAVQTSLTTLASLLALGLLFGLTVSATGSEARAVGGTTLVFFGINVGGRAGALDCFQNNNAVVHLYLILTVYLLYLVWQAPQNKPRGVALGLALGSLAAVYETHFGLLMIVLVVALVAAAFSKKPLRGLGLAFALAGLLAATQGGPITKLAKRLVGSAPSSVSLSEGEMNQRQVVVLKFPKRELFQLQLGYGDYQRVSCAYRVYPFLTDYAPIAAGTPYRPLWSWDVLQIHWLATYLAPFSLFLLWREREVVGLSIGLFAVGAFVTPGLVNFGPIYEFEYYRWQYAAGLGFAYVLGSALGKLVEQAQGRRYGWVSTALALFLVGLCIYPFFKLFLPRAVQGWARYSYRPLLLLPLKAKPWLRLNAEKTRFYPMDLEAAERLRQLSRPGQTLLVNFPHEAPSSIHLQSTLSGWTGLRLVGHSLPLDGEPVGTPPYHMSALARAFWKGFDPAALDLLEPDWIYLRQDIGFDKTRARLRELEGVEEVERTPSWSLFRVDRPRLSWPEEFGAPQDSLQVEWLGQDSYSTGFSTDVTIRLTNLEPDPISPGTRLAYGFGEPPERREMMVVTLPRVGPQESLVLTIPVATPITKGLYDLQLFLLKENKFCRVNSPPSKVRIGLD